MKVEDRSRILHAIATARTWLDDLIAARVESTDAIALREGCVRAIIEGRLPRGIGIKHLAELPASWPSSSERSVRMTLSLASPSPTIARRPRVLIFPPASKHWGHHPVGAQPLEGRPGHHRH